jgi:8-oxo-dGTP diphosphatase
VDEARARGARDLAVTTVRAAGGVVWRRSPAGALEVLVVHRPRYDDWGLPKGKAEPGESDADCAQREVEEETGLRCTIGDEVGAVEYVDNQGRPKVVRYFAMQPEGGAFSPHAEVDEVRWLDVASAVRKLTYAHDRALLERCAGAQGSQRL